MKINQFDKPTLRAMRPEIEKALSVLEGVFGVKVNLGGASYSDSHVTFKFEMAVIGEGGQAETKMVTDFKQYAQMFDFEPTDLGREFVAQGKRYVICGLKPGATRMPIIASRVPDGKRFKFSTNAVRAGLLGPKSGKGEVQTIAPTDVVTLNLGNLLGGQSQPPASKPSSGATKRVWEICDAHEGEDRSEIIAACTAEGINPSTAATQYGKWKKARQAK